MLNLKDLYSQIPDSVPWMYIGDSQGQSEERRQQSEERPPTQVGEDC